MKLCRSEEGVSRFQTIRRRSVSQLLIFAIDWYIALDNSVVISGWRSSCVSSQYCASLSILNGLETLIASSVKNCIYYQHKLPSQMCIIINSTVSQADFLFS